MRLNPFYQSAILLLYCVFYLPVTAATPVQIITSFESRVDFSGDWYYLPGDNTKELVEQTRQNTWQVASLPFSLSRMQTGNQEVLWLQKSFRIDPLLAENRLFLLLGRLSGACEVYLNGTLIGIHGSFPPDMQYHSNKSKSFHLPRQLLPAQAENTIAIRLYHEAAEFELPAFSLGSSADFYFEEYFVNFLNVSIFQSLTILCLIIAIFFFIQFIFRTGIKTNLYFSLVNLCFSLYFLNMGFERKFIPYPFAQYLSQSMLPLFFGLLVIFHLNYFNLHNKKWLKRIVLGKAIILCLLFYIIPANSVECSNLFTIVLLPSVIELFFMGYLVGRVFLRGKRDVLPLLIGTLLGVGLGAHDMYYMAIGKTPVAWLQGIGIFAFDFSMFIYLAIGNVKMYQKLEYSSRKLSGQQQDLSLLLEHLNRISGQISGISTRLDKNIRNTSLSISRMAAGSALINNNIDRQFAVITTTNAEILGQLQSLETIYQGVTRQFASVEEITPVIDEITGNIREVSGQLQVTSEFTKQLQEAVSEGEDATLSASHSMSEIKSVSEQINEFIDAVAEITEKTNLLSINTSIEAAHAGTTGRGFKIIAGEIKKLAGNSAKRSKEIMEQVKVILRKINAGVTANNRVRELLLLISKRTASAAAKVADIGAVISRQQTCSGKVQDALQSLQASTTDIRTLVNTQSHSSRQVKDSLESVVSISREMMNGIKSITLEISQLQQEIETVKAVSGDSSRIIGQMTEVLETRRIKPGGVV